MVAASYMQITIMKHKNEMAVYIPTPCHENWDAMTPTQKGKFCNACAKQVVDFSLMSDNQVLEYFKNSTGRVCGRFAEDQLQRPLQPTVQAKNKSWWLAFTMPLLFLFNKSRGQEIIMEPDTTYLMPQPKQPEIMGKVAVRNVEEKIVKLKVIDQSGNPISYANIIYEKKDFKDNSDNNGVFMIDASKCDATDVLEVTSIGYESKRITAGELLANDEFVVTLYPSVMGFVDFDEAPRENFSIQRKLVDENGNPVPFASIVIAHKKRGAISGDDGMFNISTKKLKQTDEIIISSVGWESKTLTLKDLLNSPTVALTASHALLGEVVVTRVGGAVACRKPSKKDTVATKIKELLSPNTFKVYPNPATAGNFINMQIKQKGDFQILLFDETGNLVSTEEHSSDNAKNILMFQLPPFIASGIYYLKAEELTTKKSYTQKIIIQ